MAKQQPIKQDGTIVEALPNAQFRVELDNGHEIFSSCIRKNENVLYKNSAW